MKPKPKEPLPAKVAKSKPASKSVSKHAALLGSLGGISKAKNSLALTAARGLAKKAEIQSLLNQLKELTQ